jgi:hypothetical protein
LWNQKASNLLLLICLPGTLMEFHSSCSSVFQHRLTPLFFNNWTIRMEENQLSAIIL